MAESESRTLASDQECLTIDAQNARAAAMRQSAGQAAAAQEKASKRSSGLFSQWLRRRDTSSSALPLPEVSTSTDAAAVAQDQGTPTWSEASEASEFANIDATPPSPSASQSVSAESSANASMTEQQSAAKLTDRLGGWLTGVTSVAGVMLGGAVRGSTRALQKLTAQPPLQDLHAASQDLEATATDLQGAMRMRVLTHWCQLLKQLHPDKLPADPLYSLSPLPPGSPQPRRSDSDWQQLHVARPHMPASKLAVSVPVHALSHPQHTAALVPLDSNADAQHAPSNETHTAAEDWVSQVWYIGHLPGLPGQQALTFRELFLHSYALENIIVGYISHPPDSADERKLLGDLFGLCLSGDMASHGCLVNALLNVAAVEAECRSSGTAGSLGPQQPALAHVVAETICGIKIKAEAEVLQRKMAALEGHIAEQAAEVHRSNKFDSGAKGPSADSSPTKLASGLAGTAEIMRMSSDLHQLASQKAQQLAAQAKPQYDTYLDTAKDHTTVLSTTLAALQAKSNVANKRKADGQAFRDRKLEEMSSALQEVAQEIGGLETHKAELLRQLSLVQQDISAAQARQADMEEGRHVFQEGNAFTLEALQHQVDELSTQQRHHIAEGAALAECQTLIQEAAKAWDSAQVTSQASCQASTDEARQEYMHAATRHLYYQRALLQLLLRQLTFCVKELQGVDQKESSLERMGMEGIIHDMRASRQRLLAKYTEAHSAVQHHLSDVAAVRSAVDKACSPAYEADAGSPDTRSQTAGSLDGSTAGEGAEQKAAVLPHPLAVPAAPPSSLSQPSALPSAQQQPSHLLQMSAPTQSPPQSAKSGIHAAAAPQSPSQAAHQSVAAQALISGLSEELEDLFMSIEGVRQEVEALPQPGSLTPVTDQEQDQAADSEVAVQLQREGAHAQNPAQPASQPQQQAGGYPADSGKVAMATSGSADSEDLLDTSFTSA